MNRKTFKTRILARGLTLVELMTTLTVAGILVAVAAPSFTRSIQNNRAATQINEFNASLSLARSEAIKRNENVTVCKSSNGTSCTGNWENGWIVFSDDDADSAIDEGDEILRVYGSLPDGSTLSFNQTRVIFQGSGLVDNDSQGTFTLCDARGADYAKGLIIGLTGHVTLAQDSDSDGVPNDDNDENLVCSS